MRDQDQLNRRTDVVETDLAQDNPHPDDSARSSDTPEPQAGRPAGRSAWATTPTQAETTAWVESTDPERTAPTHREQDEHADRDVRPDRPDRLDQLADDPDRGKFHEPAPQPSALGATTVGGAVAASAMAGGTGAVQRDDQDKDMVAKGDGLTAGTVSGDRDEVDRLQTQTRYQPPAKAVTARSDESPHIAGTPAETDESARHRESGGPTRPDGPAALTLLPETAGQGFHDRWREIQLRFVDDPQGSVAESRQLVEEVIDSLTAALAARKDEIGQVSDGDSVDTEELRMAIRRHRDLLDQLLNR
ncbi:hypothetical protein GCM10027280_25120 [Micromonospora polyrhachis]|uniref:Uncharacterized protein n=1 Tax=Micromonospora polyrhachis TaxID=1282883 RepID=A0A7W7ST66_9ACTN|nr:hypothetical protein [Micromonospora polyrhachis]MBB4960396.1 hypothetical protein [Micromonospora polyrhachis]